MVPPISDESLMPFGKKYRGYKMVNIPGSYLLYIYRECSGLRPDLKAYIEAKMPAIKAQIKRTRKQIRR